MDWSTSAQVSSVERVSGEMLNDIVACSRRLAGSELRERNAHVTTERTTSRLF